MFLYLLFKNGIKIYSLIISGVEPPPVKFKPVGNFSTCWKKFF